MGRKPRQNVDSSASVILRARSFVSSARAEVRSSPTGSSALEIVDRSEPEDSGEFIQRRARFLQQPRVSEFAWPELCSIVSIRPCIELAVELG